MPEAVSLPYSARTGFAPTQRPQARSSSNLPSSVAPPMRRLARLYHLLLHVFDCAAVGEQHLVGVLH